MAFTQNQIGLVFPVPIAKGGTNNSSAIGATGTLVQSDGSKMTYTTATYPSTAGATGTIMRSNGTNWVNSTPTFPDTATSGKIMRADGTNWVESTAQYPNVATSAGTIMRADGTNWVASTPTFPNTATSGKIMRADGTNWVESTAQYPNTAGTSGNVLTSDGTNWISSPATGGLTFNTVTASTQSLAVNNAYYSTYAGTCVMTLPSTAAVGSVIRVITDSSHAIQIAQNASQLIYCGAQNGVSLVTTTGTGGSITTTDPNTVIEIQCIVTDTTWEVLYANNSYNGV